MYSKVSLTLAILLIQGALALSVNYPLCQADPGLPLEAGRSTLSVTVHSPMDERCEATMYFSDPSFLPIRYSFDVMPCEGGHVLAFTVPAESPNGDVDVVWQCTGLAPTCNHRVISGGDANSSMPLQSSGRVGCLVEARKTKTTLVTITRSSGTFVETAPTVLVTSSTSFLHNSEDQPLSTGPIYLDTEGETMPATGTALTTGTMSTTGTKLAVETASTKRTSVSTRADDPLSETVTTPTTLADSTNKLPMEEPRTTTKPSDGSVFVSNAAKTSNPLIPAVTASILSTLTVIHTVAARCTT